MKNTELPWTAGLAGAPTAALEFPSLTREESARSPYLLVKLAADGNGRILRRERVDTLYLGIREVYGAGLTW